MFIIKQEDGHYYTFFISYLHFFPLNVDYIRIYYCSMNLHHGYSGWWAPNMKTYISVLCIPGIGFPPSQCFLTGTSFSHAWRSSEYVVPQQMEWLHDYFSVCFWSIHLLWTDGRSVEGRRGGLSTSERFHSWMGELLAQRVLGFGLSLLSAVLP